tara:strand:- start:575 stop:865 length:291 start_codon:yes stop_codon:yes gene_type:complete
MADSKESTWQDRLGRIESKVDQLTEAMVSLARAEEKITSMQSNHDKQYDRINKLSVKIDEIERIVLENHRTVCFIQKLFWVVVATAAAAIATHIWM